ncbi:unnamed protein product [Ceratitis capitata]|uniref:(Mediterranean fruit fly) hypothetical protein n=1 Tax=Ceratitis capitata TaxID=7213 RepID=A0A811UJL8_CERCA|nr:unnamed protein product [Ceratitis capitata]
MAEKDNSNLGEKLEPKEEQKSQSTSVSPKISPGSSPISTLEQKRRKETDARTIFISNVSSSASPEDLTTYFSDCGKVNHVTMLCNKVDGHAKGLAYIEFSSKEAVPKALALNGQLFRERELRISMKRASIPGMQMSEHFPRGSFHGYGQFRERGRRSCSPHGSPRVSGSKSTEGFLG